MADSAEENLNLHVVLSRVAPGKESWNPATMLQKWRRLGFRFEHVPIANNGPSSLEDTLETVCRLAKELNIVVGRKRGSQRESKNDDHHD